MRNSFASRPYTVPPKRLRHSTRIWNGPYPQGPPPTLYTHFQTHPTVGYAPTLVNSWFQPQPANPNNPNGSYIQPQPTSFPNYSYFMPPQPIVGYPSSNIYSHSIQPQPMHSKSTNNTTTNSSIECPFIQLPETIQFSKMLDDPEGFRAVTPTNSFDSVGYDVYGPDYPSKDIVYYLEPGRQAIIDTGIVLDIPLDLPKHIRIAAMVKDKSSVVTRYQLAVETGVIDPTYRGSVKVVVRNISEKTVFFTKGMKPAQIVFQLHWCPTFQQVEYTDRSSTDMEGRGTRGFGGDEFENVMHNCGSSVIEKIEDTQEK
ncbi:deoxyuridine 5'-triphosphate nucleotidohydrolase [Caerostris darwini]|uniref:Deoxyuridine 5'-triphosphate nucleotidohydrolase n=1 Tax=Caerostris darwini TaxID=1538125 RepID=A0AAV4SUQ9_9ARAC|nr:deoxyuridine 5'-triphosphate nucleotidohydrolase [Caerostris darwini]